MKKYIIALATIFYSIVTYAQVLTVPLATQEQTNWCWAACSKCVLGHYGQNYSQCQIAEYTRTVATWNDYGPSNCCVNASNGCNWVNYNWGQTGSIQDILQHFGSIVNVGSAVFTTSQITTEVAANHLFIPHWQWTSGGGHFVVGHGIAGSGSSATIYYMNPAPGEGFHFSTYTWMVGSSSADHTWDGTNKITSFPPVNAVSEVAAVGNNEIVYPNPSNGVVYVKAAKGEEASLYSVTGKLVYTAQLQNEASELQLGFLPKGIYIMKTSSAAGNKFTKLVLQ
jgi:hypothetical protein